MCLIQDAFPGIFFWIAIQALLFYFERELYFFLTRKTVFSKKTALSCIFLELVLTTWGLICGKAKAMSIIAQQLGRTVYYMLKRKEAFNPDKFYGDKKIENKDSDSEHLA